MLPEEKEIAAPYFPEKWCAFVDYFRYTHF